ncbi:hypothetical protein Y1Q_0002283 [Alligator mississippiensis]|uniref:Uncharacterized protein n=1 Tax=Alligator mississippiensis TaxID=8496 RepID=A0A151MGJ7_ALLMI|nr:hypothetical protein Y1Q_0002283 [Alligator mississippiensis]
MYDKQIGTDQTAKGKEGEAATNRYRLEEIAELKTCIKRMSTENGSLLEKMKVLQKATDNKSPRCCLLLAVHKSTETLTISQYSSFDCGSESTHCFDSCHVATCISMQCVAGTTLVEEDIS